MRPSREPDYAKDAREFTNFLNAIQTQTKDGLTFRPMVLTEKTRTRGGHRSRRRKARVWEPRQLDLSDAS